MSEKPPLSDEEVYDRLHEAFLALGKEAAYTVAGQTTMTSARFALLSLQQGLLMATESNSDHNCAIADPSKLREL